MINQEQTEDAAQVERAAAGDGAALAGLYDRHARAVYSIALRIVGDETEAEDVVQDVFTQVWRQASRYDDARGTVAAWLVTIARTRALDRLRARLARPDAAGMSPKDSWSEPASVVKDPIDALAAACDAKRVKEALDGLPLLQRLAIELAYFEGLTQSQIADRLQEPLGTVKTRIRLGLLKLRDSLSRTDAGGAV